MSDPQLPGPEEAQALRRWRDEGDLQGLDQLLRMEIMHLKRRLRAKGVDRGSMGASDYVDEVVLRMLRQDPAPHFEEASAMRAYLWKAARNLLIDQLRARRGDTVHIDAASSAGFANILAESAGEHPLLAAERTRALEVALNLLADPDREVLELTYLEGLSGPEVAERLDIKPEALRMRLVRARRRLGKLLAEWQDLIE